MDEVGIEIYTDTTCREVTSSGVVCTKDGGDLVLEGETIAAALGLKANTSVVEELRHRAAVCFHRQLCTSGHHHFRGISGVSCRSRYPLKIRKYETAANSICGIHIYDITAVSLHLQTGK